MKAYKIELLIIDHDADKGGVRRILGHPRYLYSQVKTVEIANIGNWSDEHPLNRRDTADAEYRPLFPSKDR